MIFNFGSINVDHVYRLDHLPKAGETLAAKSYQRFLGGKGVNQSIAVAKSGGKVCHIGGVGPDGGWALDQISELGVPTDTIARSDAPTGNATIYVDDAGENQIVILGGANQNLSVETAQEVVSNATSDDWFLFQNEINLSAEIVQIAKSKGSKVAYSAAPFDAEKVSLLLPDLYFLAVNEDEASEVENLLNKPPQDWGVPMVLITLGSKGAKLLIKGVPQTQEAFPVSPLDTTGAGDTFLGAFLARLDSGETTEQALKFAAAASAVQVTKMGAAAAIPSETVVKTFLKEHS